MRKILSCGFVVFGLVVACAEDQPAPSPAVPIQSTAPVSPSPTPVLTGFHMPIAGSCLPKSDKLMPNAPREYRKGTHEGIDFYNSDSCTFVNKGTRALAAKAGRVIRADRTYVDVNKKQVDAFLANPDTPESLDQFRGRQVWIDHGGGVVTRYCHLNGVATGFEVGSQVQAGQLVGFVGESGTPSSVTKPGSQFHLHFELRVGDSFLGKALPPKSVRALYTTLFKP